MSETTHIMVTIQDVCEAVRDLGLSGRPVCVHSSLGSFGWVQGGPTTVIKGLLAAGCTMMVPTFSYSFAVPPPVDGRPEQNGWGYTTFTGPTAGIGKVFSPDRLECDQVERGAIPVALLTLPTRVRGNHPLDSFTAVSPLASKLMSTQQPLKPYAPLRVLTEAQGSIILMGVGLDKMTLLHYAEQVAGRRLFIRWANNADHQAMAVEVGGCSAGFPNFEVMLSPLMKERNVGQSRWHVYPAKGVLEAILFK